MKHPIAVALVFLLTAALIGGSALAETTLAWSDLLDGGGMLADNARVAITVDSGNLIVAGESTERLGGSAFFIRKQDRLTGAEIWSSRIPAYDGSDMAVTQMIEDGSGDIMVSGYIAGCGT